MSATEMQADQSTQAKSLSRPEAVAEIQRSESLVTAKIIDSLQIADLALEPKTRPLTLSQLFKELEADFKDMFEKELEEIDSMLASSEKLSHEHFGVHLMRRSLARRREEILIEASPGGNNG